MIFWLPLKPFHLLLHPSAVKLPCFEIREVYLTNLVEENITPLEYKDDLIEISAEPFQMITLRLRSGMHIPGNSKFFYSY